MGTKTGETVKKPTMKNMEPRRIVMKSIDDVRPAGFNPASRTENKRIRRMVESLMFWGEIISPLIISREGLIADGHRRYFAAKALGWPAVPCIITEYSIQALWADLNGTQMPLGTMGLTEAVQQGLAIDLTPKRFRQSVLWIEDLFPNEAWEMYCPPGRSIQSLMEWTRRVTRYIGRPDAATERKTVMWFSVFNTVLDTRKAMSAGIEQSELALAIDAMVPLVYLKNVGYVANVDFGKTVAEARRQKA